MALASSFRMRYLLLHTGMPSRRNGVCSKLKVKQQSTSTQTSNLQFVPRSDEASKQDIQRLADFVAKAERLFVITGAGISTESGIPDYRSEGVGLYSRNRKPIQYVEFLKSTDMRQRYWARNYVGWPKFSSFEPNQSHFILSKWEQTGKIHWLVTQNVDTLHHKAGSRRVTELHGSTHRIICLSCDHKLSRHTLQETIKALNPHWHAHSSQIAPDGDIDLTPEQIQGFKVPSCEKCGGILKPEIVFFGDNVPRATVELVNHRLSESDAVLVIGSSLEVYSAFRITLRASECRTPMAILNIGKTRGDNMACVKVDARCGPVLRQVHDVLATLKVPKV